MEGGRRALDGGRIATICHDLSFLSLYYQPQTELVSRFNMTSAATSGAAESRSKNTVELSWILARNGSCFDGTFS